MTLARDAATTELGKNTVIQVGVELGALAAVVLAVLFGQFPHPFPWLEFIATVAAVAAIRRYGLPLPGKGFASFVLGAMVFAVLRHGWEWAVVTGLVGMPIGDIALRRLKLRAALANVGHVLFGTALVGFLYRQLGGATASAAAVLAPSNMFELAVLLLALALLINATFYVQLASAHQVAFVDVRLTMRWEAVVYVMSAVLALGWLWGISTGGPLAYRVAVVAALVSLTAGAHWIARTGVRADELRLLHRLSRAIAAEVDLQRNFATIQELTRQLVPWDHMGFASYDETRNEMELVADTDPANRPGARYSADSGLTGEALRRRRPVVAAAGSRGAVAGANVRGSEIMVPLRQGDRIVGVWSVRHSDGGMYRDLDAVLLDSLAPQLALALRLHALIAPLVDSSEQTAQYVEHLTATSQQIHASSQEVTAAAQRAEAGAIRAADLVGETERAMSDLRSAAAEAANAGEETHRAAQAVEAAAQAVRAGTQKTTLALERIGATVDESAAEVARLREAADQVGRFAETIGTIANQTNMLALNATIEAARAGAQGAGFAVVADEVRRLAEESGREAAQAARTTAETRRVLDHAAQLLERMRTELTAVAETARSWIAELEDIARASETASSLSTRMVEFPRRNVQRVNEMHRLLEELRRAAQTSAAEAQVVASAAAEQLQAIENLSRSAVQLSGNAEQLAQAARLVRA